MISLQRTEWGERPAAFLGIMRNQQASIARAMALQNVTGTRTLPEPLPKPSEARCQSICIHRPYEIDIRSLPALADVEDAEGGLGLCCVCSKLIKNQLEIMNKRQQSFKTHEQTIDKLRKTSQTQKTKQKHKQALKRVQRSWNVFEKMEKHACISSMHAHTFLRANR